MLMAAKGLVLGSKLGLDCSLVNLASLALDFALSFASWSISLALSLTSFV